MLAKLILSLSLTVAMIAALGMPQLSLQAAPLEEIKLRGKLIVGVKDNLRPLGFYNLQGNLQGLEIDIAKRLAEELLGNSEAIVFQVVKNTERLEAVINGKVDLTIARVTNTPSRSRLVDLSACYYLDGTGLISKNPSLENESARIAVLKNSSTIPVIRYNLPNATLVGVDSYKEAKAVLDSGEADAFAADLSILTGWQQQYPEYYVLKKRLSGEALCVVIPRGLNNTELQRKVYQAIARMKQSGWLRERASYWGLP